jgi:hypothetical protein
LEDKNLKTKKSHGSGLKNGYKTFGITEILGREANLNPSFDLRIKINDHARGGCAFGAFSILDVFLIL